MCRETSSSNADWAPFSTYSRNNRQSSICTTPGYGVTGPRPDSNSRRFQVRCLRIEWRVGPKYPAEERGRWRMIRVAMGLILMIVSVARAAPERVESEPAAKSAEPQPFGPIPSPRQLSWHEMEFYGFLHFTVNTFTDKEWGYGDEDENV